MQPPQPKIFCIALLIALSSIVTASPNRDSLFIESQCRLTSQHRWQEKPFSIIVAMVAQLFSGKPYAGGTLDSSAIEKCHFTSDGFDCVTLVESALALSRCIKRNRCDFSHFIAELEFIRYRRGRCDGYASRLHYTSDWINDNQRKGVLANISRELGGMSIRKSINFMSTHPTLYRQLRDSSTLVRSIAAIERRLSRQPMTIIPRTKIRAALDKIHSGDIIAIATTKDGLDYAHLGIALRTGGQLGLIHASSKTGTVTYEPRIMDYLDSFSSASGISVLRPLDPTQPAKKLQ